jgi:hypothetical protein
MAVSLSDPLRDPVEQTDDDEAYDGECGGGDHGRFPFGAAECVSSASTSSMVWSARASASRYSGHTRYASPSQADAVLTRSLGISFLSGVAWQKTIVTWVK